MGWELSVGWWMVAVKQIRIRNRIWVRQADELTIWDDDNAQYLVEGQGVQLGGR
jgi:hypothetical protein